ncbi:DNA protecting protein DprA [Ancylobacter novellus DSM 506]|uniref:DNA protecting protein DprA n=1 Tax=Ancylobacter novellus (strain ATCC 8093 / DSM 506 / JCM 20403 / CCM 1077 / IAM 12100 / NBRC 12443 / NCIMB 10456) TaxID=639283 RepID=D7A9P9_ANCN5|nr:DNA-processing protein DprA [Ancylobacter novellus]ADH88825.1 DNA protecting protein DprA [Ancylobacter novellus DSM 506]
MAPRGVQLDLGQRRDWLRLIRTENVGPRAFRSLVNRFGGAAAALDALPALARRGGGLIPPRIPSAAEAEAEMAALDRMGGRFIALGEPDYPELLRQIDDAPPLIALRGKPQILVRPTVAIVGSRNASGAGRTMTVRIARGLGAAGWVIASGLARGIDAMAHEASLATGTVAVIAGGHDRPYPRENEKLMEAIAAEGAILSEMPMGWEPRARDFPRRNRLVSGLSLGVVVVEAAERSGSLITARLAAEQGREVFAVPGSPLDPRASGTNALIQHGAALVTGAEDILQGLAALRDRPPPLIVEEEADAMDAPEPSEDARTHVLALLGPVPLPVDDLVVLSGASVGEIQILLLELELAGRLERHPGGAVSLI